MEFDQPPLFDMPPPGGVRRPLSRPQSRTVGHGRCPDHLDVSARGTAIWTQGAHVVWAIHKRGVGKHASLLQCSASGVPLCVAADGDGMKCPCGREE